MAYPGPSHQIPPKIKATTKKQKSFKSKESSSSPYIASPPVTSTSSWYMCMNEDA